MNELHPLILETIFEFLTDKEHYENVKLVNKEWLRIARKSITPIQSMCFALKNGYTDIVKEILNDKRIDPSKEDNKVIITACRYGNVEIVKILLRDNRIDLLTRQYDVLDLEDYYHFYERYTDIDQSLLDGASYLLFVVCDNEHVELLKEILADSRFDPSFNNNKLIGVMCFFKNKYNIVKELLKDPRVDPSIKSCQSLRMAVYGGNLEIVKELLKDPRVDPSSYGILSTASTNNIEIVKVLMEDGRYNESECRSIINYHVINDIKVIKEVLKYIKVQPSIEGSALLRNVCRLGDLELLKKLLKDKEMSTPELVNDLFRYAVCYGNLEIVKELLTYDCLEPCELEISLACNNKHPEIVMELLKRGKYDFSLFGNFVFDLSVKKGYLDVVKELLKNECVDPSDKENEAIRNACKFGHLEIVKELLKDKRVDPSAKGNEALHNAQEFKHLEIVELLSAYKSVKIVM